MPRLAAIDFGTNSVKMTIAEVEHSKSLNIISEQSEITRLGRGVDDSNRLSADAIDATLDALRKFVKDANSQNAKILACGTSAMRDAQNGEEFRSQASEIMGTDLEIITGDREANLAFIGAMSDIDQTSAMDSDILTFDVGGGSTELIIGASTGIKRSVSLNIGAVRITERVLRDDPPTKEQINEAQELIYQNISSFGVAGIGRVVGIGGTAATILSMAKAANKIDSAVKVVSQNLVKQLIDDLVGKTVEIRRHIPGLDPKRADIILAGFMIISSILDYAHLGDLTVSKRGVRHGLLLDWAAKN